MDEARRLARLPGNLDTASLETRSAPYLRLPNHLGADPALRDREYRSLLPEGAVTVRGAPFRVKFLRWAAHLALLRRAAFEVSALRASGRHDKAALWEAEIKAAQEAYDEEVQGRKDMFFRSLERRRSIPGAGGLSPEPPRGARNSSSSAAEVPEAALPDEHDADDDDLMDMDIAIAMSLSMMGDTARGSAGSVVDLTRGADEEIAEPSGGNKRRKRG